MGYLVYEGDCPRCGDRLGEPDDDGTRWCVCGVGVAAAAWGFEPIDQPTAGDGTCDVIFGPCPTKRQCGCDGSGVGYDNQDGGYPYACLCRDPTWVHENCPHC